MMKLPRDGKLTESQCEEVILRAKLLGVQTELLIKQYAEFEDVDPGFTELAIHRVGVKEELNAMVESGKIVRTTDGLYTKGPDGNDKH